MNPALFTLIRLQYKGFIRRMVRGSKSPRRAIFLVIGLVVITVWLLLGVIPAIAVKHPERLSSAPHRFRAVAPLALLGICVLTIVSSAGDKAIAFTAGEVDMLFPGPFSRRELLAFKLSKSTLAACLTALLLSFAMLTYAGSWPACYIGVFLTLIFIQLFSTAGVLLGQAMGQRAQTLLRKGLIILALVVGLLLSRNWIATRGGMEAVYQLRDSQLGRNILAPFDPFARTITADDFGQLVESAGEATLIDIGLLMIVILLDANYVEAALSASRRRYAQVQRIRGGSLLSSGVKGNVTWSLPRPPWLGGAGPIIWRQATSAVRSARGLLLVLIIVVIGIGPLLGSALPAGNVAQMLVYIMAWLTILLSGLLKFDFRGDIDHIEELKSLPIRPAMLALGQLVVPTVFLTTAHLLLLGSLALATRSHARTHHDFLLVAACLALPFNALLMAAENLIFLLFPSRPAAASPGDFQVMGRQAAQLIMKSLLVMIGLGIAIGIAVPFYVLLGGSLPILAVIAGTFLIGETWALIPAIARAFNRFDPSVDTPA